MPHRLLRFARNDVRNWLIHPRDPSSERIAGEFRLHPLVAQVLVRRGLRELSSVSDFLNPSFDRLEDPAIFRDMRRAVERILAAIARRERIVVYGDYDADGVTGSAILHSALKKAGADAGVHIPDRLREGYGLTRAGIERLLGGEGCGLLITVDTGIAAVEPVAFLNSKGVDVIIVDHHRPKETLPPAYAIVSAVVGKGDAGLAGCGLAFKLAWALLGGFEAVSGDLDLLVVGTVADIAPVQGENRVILKKGLTALADTRRPGLRALMREAGIHPKKVSYRDIAFLLAPRINAAGRLGYPEKAFRLLTTQDESEAGQLARELEEGNRQRQKMEAEAYGQAVKRVGEGPHGEDSVLVLESPEWHEGVLGIVAARLMERFQRPSIVISLKEGRGKGSGRSPSFFSLFDRVRECEELLEEFGGHAQALGLTIREENIPAFRERLNRAGPAPAGGSAADLDVEGELSLGELTVPFLRDLEKLAPFGPGNKKPFFLSRRLEWRAKPARRGQDNLQGWVTGPATGASAGRPDRTVYEVVGYSKYQRWKAIPAQGVFDAVYQPVLRDFDGVTFIQLELEDWR